MSLGSWFRDYVYIPLGGNRVSKTKWLHNILVVWLLTGLWHGAAWNFVLWGLFFAVFLTAEKLWYGRALAKTRVFKHIYVLLLVIVSFVLFDANSVGEVAATIGGLFGAAGVSAVNPISRCQSGSWSSLARPEPEQWSSMCSSRSCSSLCSRSRPATLWTAHSIRSCIFASKGVRG